MMLALEKFLRTIHAWLGFFVMPLIIVIGFTGFYLNHSDSIYAKLPNGTWDETQMDLWPNPKETTEEAARALASRTWPTEAIRNMEEKSYHDRPAYFYTKDSGLVIVTKATGHYWVKSRYNRLTVDPNGQVVNEKKYWTNIFKTLHTDGWINSPFGSLLADIAALAMMFFGLSGIILFLRPRLGRRKNGAINTPTPRGGKSGKGTPVPRRIKMK